MVQSWHRSLQNLFGRKRTAQGMVQPAGRHEKQARPLLNPATLKPMTFEELRPVFCDELVRQELDDTTPYFEIPGEILDFYKMYRPSPLIHAEFLEKALGTPAKIYYNLRATTPLVPTSSTPPSPRPITPSSRASRASPPKPAPASGAPPCPWPAPSSGWTARCSW